MEELSKNQQPGDNESESSQPESYQNVSDEISGFAERESFSGQNIESFSPIGGQADTGTSLRTRGLEGDSNNLFFTEDRASSFRDNGEREKETVEKIIPPLEWPSKADPLLTNTSRRLLQVLWAIVVSRALTLDFPLERSVVLLFKDPIEDDRKIILNATTNANITQTLAFWDGLELDLQRWMGTLSKNDRLTFITRITLQMNWK